VSALVALRNIDQEAMMVCFIWNNPSALKHKKCHPHRLDSHTAVTVDFDPYTKGGVES